MKKLLCFFLFSLFSTGIYSQQGKIKFGIQMGAAFAKSKMDYVNQAGDPALATKNGFIAGCFLNYTLSDKLIMQPALLYVRKGALQNFQNSFNLSARYNYIELPLNILYKAKTVTGMYLLGGGLSPAFKLNSIISTNEVKSFDLGVNALAMYQFTIGFSVNLRYTYSLLNTSAVKSNFSKIQHKYFSLTAGYEF
jgi:hypothetical protein